MAGFGAFLRGQGCRRIRIDVATGYNPHVLRFWESSGFTSEREITLHWNGKEIPAVKMVKDLTALVY
jgi:hypothetical protein